MGGEEKWELWESIGHYDEFGGHNSHTSHCSHSPLILVEAFNKPRVLGIGSSGHEGFPRAIYPHRGYDKPH